MGFFRATAKHIIKRGLLFYRVNRAKYAEYKNELNKQMSGLDSESAAPDKKSSSTLRAVARPLLKEAVKGGIVLYESSRKKFHTIKGDIKARIQEARDEMKEPEKKALPSVRDVAAPVAKEAIKGGMVFYRKIKKLISETGELGENLIAEAKTDLNKKPRLKPGKGSAKSRISVSKKGSVNRSGTARKGTTRKKKKSEL